MYYKIIIAMWATFHSALVNATGSMGLEILVIPFLLVNPIIPIVFLVILSKCVRKKNALYGIVNISLVLATLFSWLVGRSLEMILLPLILTIFWFFLYGYLFIKRHSFIAATIFAIGVLLIAVFVTGKYLYFILIKEITVNGEVYYVPKKYLGYSENERFDISLVVDKDELKPSSSYYGERQRKRSVKVTITGSTFRRSRSKKDDYEHHINRLLTERRLVKEWDINLKQYYEAELELAKESDVKGFTLYKYDDSRKSNNRFYVSETGMQPIIFECEMRTYESFCWGIDKYSNNLLVDYRIPFEILHEWANTRERIEALILSFKNQPVNLGSE